MLGGLKMPPHSPAHDAVGITCSGGLVVPMTQARHLQTQLSPTYPVQPAAPLLLTPDPVLVGAGATDPSLHH